MIRTDHAAAGAEQNSATIILPPASPAMTKIRVLTEDDVPAVADLHGRVYPEYRWPASAACEATFREVLFNNPWRDLDLPSWIAEKDGHICGCYALLPRPMRLRGRALRVAVGCQFMVDPDEGDGLTALRLAQACLAGPQDLTLADGASPESRQLWLRIGGISPPLYALHWTRPLRPALYAASLLGQRSGLSASLARAARPLAALADAVVARVPQNRFLRESATCSEGALDPATMLAHLPEILDGSALQPVYDARSLAWLLEQTALKTRHGELRACALHDGGKRLVGWYLYYLKPGGA